MTTGSNPPVGPFFTGGTGRSGTTIAAQLLGAHPEVALVPVEVSFQVDTGGLADLGEGAVDVAAFEAKMRETWFRKRPNKNGPRGVHVVATEAEVDEALADLHDAYPADPWGACRQFMSQVLAPHTARGGARTWVEMTPPNGKRAEALCRMFPQGRVIHMVRDGRDVAASVARRNWGPNDIMSALTWWGREMRVIDRSMQQAVPGQVRTIRLESLVVTRREEEYAALLEFVGLPEDESMRRFFDDVVGAESMHPGRWRDGLDPEREREVEARYEEVLAQLEADGVRMPPVD
ncbi:sulfotransferase family protein [Ornithinimicrobium cavernae]|uniref:sulfotransferase family protein n=1 Tax=Ornithinimicrobium cavernae TaxID=2666047 RepID=UPI0013798BCC|nr:sulfotransferase [Ornithinimicrobium cavernae]